MSMSKSDQEVFHALTFARCHINVEPIISAILRNFSPSQLQEYSEALGLHFSSNRSYLFRDIYTELFPRLISSRQIQLRGLSVFVIGKDLRTLNLRILSPQNPKACLEKPLNLGIVVRDANGRWPPKIEDLEDAIKCLGATKKEIEGATPYSTSDAHSLCSILLSLLIAGNKVVWAIGSYNTLQQSGFRFIWLDGSVEILVDLRRGTKKWITKSNLLGSLSTSAASLLLDGEAGSYLATATCLNQDYRKTIEVIPCSHSTFDDLNGSQVFISEEDHYIGRKYVGIDLQAVCAGGITQ